MFSYLHGQTSPYGKPAGDASWQNEQKELEIERWEESLRRTDIVSSFNTQGKQNFGFRRVMVTNIENKSSKTAKFDLSGNKKCSRVSERRPGTNATKYGIQNQSKMQIKLYDNYSVRMELYQ